MDRFEALQMYHDIILKIHLHSSMDRFEVSAASKYMTEAVIYIPVWIDLKLYNNISDLYI